MVVLDSSGRVLAAGGVIVHDGRICVIHRPRYEDWSLPKGKLEPRELPVTGALREVAEEPGFTAVAGRTLGESRYRVLDHGRDVPKTVRWWALRATGGEFVPGPEVDHLQWLDVPSALRRVTAGRDSGPLQLFLEHPPVTTTVLLVRHGSAGDREQWSGDDDLRPLDDKGQEQAAAAAELASEIKSTPLAEGSGNMSEASNKAQQGSEQAKAAEAQGEAGQQQQAASQHEQAAQNFQKSAEALDRAATEFSQAAAAAAAQQANPNKAPLPAGELAEAFQQAAQAAASEGADAAQKAAASAAALAQAAQAARSQMQGLPAGSKPAAPAGPPGMAGPASPPGTPGESGELEGLQQRAADPGVPPELAKLGITASDWEKIQANLASDIGSGGADAIPKEYRSLVKGYFESMSKKKD